MKELAIIHTKKKPLTDIIGMWECYNRTAAGFTAIKSIEFKENGTWIKKITILENLKQTSCNGEWSITEDILTKTKGDSIINEKFEIHSSYLTIDNMKGLKKTWIRKK